MGPERVPGPSPEPWLMRTPTPALQLKQKNTQDTMWVSPIAKILTLHGHRHTHLPHNLHHIASHSINASLFQSPQHLGSLQASARLT